MGFLAKSYAISVVVVVVYCLPALICSQEVVKQSVATYYYAPGGLGSPNGECGYGEYGRTINDGDAAVVTSSKLYKSGAGCGACYKIWCKEEECNQEGVVVVVTDHGGGSGADMDFVLSTHAFNKMAQPGLERDLMDYGKVGGTYQRVACQYPTKNLTLKVEERSQYHSYLALLFLYQAGNSDITAVELFEEDTLEWRTCRRSYGAVWDMANPPKGALTMRVFLGGSATSRARWLLLPKVIPAFWEPGLAYDTFLQL